MKDTIYLTIAKDGVKHMRKSYNGSKKGEIVAKLHVEVENKAFSPPVIEKRVMINDWEEGVDVEDVRFDKRFITEEEAEEIRQKRIKKMKRILQEQGYTVEEAEEEISSDVIED